jgi:hypothetical protein
MGETVPNEMSLEQAVQLLMLATDKYLGNGADHRAFAMAWGKVTSALALLEEKLKADPPA